MNYSIGWRRAVGGAEAPDICCVTLSLQSSSETQTDNMKLLWCLAALLAVSFAQDELHTSPKVQVYSGQAGEFGKPNTLICHVSGFHPPDISIQLMKDGQELPNANQTDLAFNQNWRFHLTRNVDFTPTREDKYTCRVTHGKTLRDYAWEPNM